MKLFLLRAGEYMLKKGTKPFFEKSLRTNLKRSLKEYVHKITMLDGRIYVQHKEEFEAKVQSILEKTFGIADFHLAYTATLTMKDIQTAIQQLINHSELEEEVTFKVESKRANKSFPHTSYDLSALLGGWLLADHPKWRVDVHRPKVTIVVEIREQVYVYLIKNQERNGAGGLPVGSVGRGVLLLSGGIDSPVAGYLTCKRGLNLVAVHFHTPPYTGEESLEKVKALAQSLSGWNSGKIALYIINFTSIQLEVNKLSKGEFTTIVSRILMMQIASKIQEKEEAKALITGEALAQVASQTLESLQVTDALTPSLVIRPCIGMDKNEIIHFAQKIHTFETSIIPATDCCSLFAPKHPSTRPKEGEVRDLLAQCHVEHLINEAIESAQIIILSNTN
ncbi:tRNA 4-thiouridine(8) synthase ThiI [Entomospira entomophila]|uniref:Probable tRNA sulfurtransferase n=1 Tax=Entomospira entomophila TaxID=2719988 RepID=A0A968GD75_9SPIO|nr:tRNA uracil 4-sulfurtransferase ThiI [Entomospira entomophilus]NIZ40839.1 tRNA 4-thiouridine(8) synthase ThiI [Entomospira entomophilus]WDI35051.1 tRNA 4-thiouridine(8) synthase ThiI [Entomospira entomophilus]